MNVAIVWNIFSTVFSATGSLVFDSLNLFGLVDLAYLHPLWYIDQEQPNEKEAPDLSSLNPWHAQERLNKQKIQFAY